MLRRTLFWIHLSCGVVAGVVIALMCATGAALAYEKELVAWAERDVRRVTPGPEGSRRGVEQVAGEVAARYPALAKGNLTVFHDPALAWMVAPAGRGAQGPTVFVDPFTGEIQEAVPGRMRAFMRTMVAWHRWLGVEGEHRNAAKAVTGACNVAFLGLAVTGLYLWWPRAWNRRVFRAISWLDFRLHGKARDFNWHNALGVWSAPVLAILTLTAMPISYRWAGDALYRLTGTPLPAAGAPPAATPAVVPPPPAGAARLDAAALVHAIATRHPEWQQMTFRLPTNPLPAGPLQVTLKESNRWPRTATTTLQIDPFTGGSLQVEAFEDLSGGRRLRTWTRFLHTGEALGWIGQAVAGLASLAGVVLAYTGLALSFRRFFGRRTAE